MLAPRDVLERRHRVRYPVELNVRYRTVSLGPALVGTGRTLNASSTGFLIACEQQILKPGVRLRLSLEWPLKLDGATPLQLLAVCHVIRCRPGQFAVQLEGYQFRTRKR